MCIHIDFLERKNGLCKNTAEITRFDDTGSSGIVQNIRM